MLGFKFYHVSKRVSSCQLMLVDFNINLFYFLVVVFRSVLLITFRVHYRDVIMGTMASQITRITIVYSIVYSGADQRKHQSYASLAFLREIHRWLVNIPSTNGQWRGKYFHLIPSSCIKGTHIIVLMPLKQPWMKSVNASSESLAPDKVSQQCKTLHKNGMYPMLSSLRQCCCMFRSHFALVDWARRIDPDTSADRIIILRPSQEAADTKTNVR